MHVQIALHLRTSSRTKYFFSGSKLFKKKFSQPKLGCILKNKQSIRADSLFHQRDINIGVAWSAVAPGRQ
jgi:hypothetical protein